MKKLFCAFFALLVVSLSVFGQKSKSDLEQLRKELGLPSTISISDDDAPMTDSDTVKIYLAIKHRKSSAKDFIHWVDKWNRTEGNRYGRLQIVDRAEDADIAAAQFQHGTSHLVREESVRVKAGKLPSGEEKDDRFVLHRIGNSNIKAESSARSLRIPIYTYLIVRDQNSGWFVKYSRVDERDASGDLFPEGLLQSALENKLKKR